MAPRTQYPCQKRFEDAANFRRKHPLTAGIFKFREAYDSLKSCAEEIERIEAYQRKEIAAYQLQQCMPCDMAQWLRTLPTYIAAVLGGVVAPGIAALAADGVPHAVVAEIERVVSRKLPEIVAKLDRGRRRLSAPISAEYERMKVGNPTLLPAIQEAVKLIAEVLAEAEQHTPYHRLPQVNAEIGGTARARPKNTKAEPCR